MFHCNILITHLCLWRISALASNIITANGLRNEKYVLKLNNGFIQGLLHLIVVLVLHKLIGSLQKSEIRNEFPLGDLHSPESG